MYKPKDIIALILALCILASVVGSIFMDSKSPIEVSKLWADLLKVILGGLIGYIMSGNNNDGKVL